MLEVVVLAESTIVWWMLPINSVYFSHLIDQPSIIQIAGTRNWHHKTQHWCICYRTLWFSWPRGFLGESKSSWMDSFVHVLTPIFPLDAKLQSNKIELEVNIKINILWIESDAKLDNTTSIVTWNVPSLVQAISIGPCSHNTVNLQLLAVKNQGSRQALWRCPLKKDVSHVLSPIHKESQTEHNVVGTCNPFCFNS